MLTFIPRDGTDDMIDLSIETKRENVFKREISDFKEFLPNGYMRFGFVCGHEQRPFYHFIPRTNLDDPTSTERNIFLTEKLFVSSHSKSKSSFCEDFLRRIVTVDVASGLFFTPWEIFYAPNIVTEPRWLDEYFVPEDLDRTMLRLSHGCFQSTRSVFYGIAVFAKGDSFGVGLCSLRSLNRDIIDLIENGQTQPWGESRRHTGGLDIILTKGSLHLVCDTSLETQQETAAVRLFSFFFYYKNRDHALFFSKGIKHYLSLRKMIVFNRLPRYEIHTLVDDLTETTIRIFNSFASQGIRDEPLTEMILYNRLHKGCHFLNINVENLFLSNHVFEICSIKKQR